MGEYISGSPPHNGDNKSLIEPTIPDQSLIFSGKDVLVSPDSEPIEANPNTVIFPETQPLQTLPPRKKWKRWNEEEINNVITGFRHNQSPAEIAQIFRTSPSIVLDLISRLRKRGIEIPRPRRWTEEKIDKVISGYIDNQPLDQIAEALKVNVPSIFMIISRERKKGREIPYRMVPRRWTEEEIAEVISRYTDNQPLAEIAEAFETNRHSISQVISNERKKGRDIPYRHRQKHKWVTDQIITDLIELIQTGTSNLQIALKYKATEGAVKSALHRLNEKGIAIPPRQVETTKLLKMFQDGIRPEIAAQFFHVSVERIKWYRTRFVREGQLPQLDKQLRNKLIAELSEQGLMAKQIVDKLKFQLPHLDHTLKIVEGVRAKLIREGLIKRHPRGKSKK